MRRPLLALLLLLLASCGGSGEAFPEACGLPSPSGNVDVSEVPDDLLIYDDAVVRQVSRQDGLLVTALNIPTGVTEAYDDYLAAVKSSPYQVINSENEGFEAEIYLKEKDANTFVAIQIRNPGCREAVSTFITIGEVPDPTGKGAKS